MEVISSSRFVLGLTSLLLVSVIHAEEKKKPLAPEQLPAVVLVADLREADEDCGCGQIIQLVREAARRGVAVREIDARKEPQAGRAYGIVVAPTVALLSADGKVEHRFVGEDTDTIKALREALLRLKSAASKSGK